MTKSEVRALIGTRKQNVNMQERLIKSQRIFEQVKQLREFKHAQRILCYWSMPEEVHTHNFMIESTTSKQMYLPVVNGKHLIIKEFTGIKNLRQNALYPIQEPSDTSAIGIDCIDMVIVPALAFDIQGTRLGRGKGYYDRLLANSTVYKLGVCFEYQLLSCIPSLPHDVAMDRVIAG
ncbi:MAG: 5-formyltetrahydrofolate cyclo-ligase [Bacteroidales bacterium]